MPLTSWNAGPLMAVVHRNIAKRMDRGGQYLRSKIMQRISKSCVGKHSRPGQAPHRETGDLYMHTYCVLHPDGLGFTAGNNSDHWQPLEMGSSRMAARPFIRVTLYRSVFRLSQILGGKLVLSGIQPNQYKGIAGNAPRKPRAKGMARYVRKSGKVLHRMGVMERKMMRRLLKSARP